MVHEFVKAVEYPRPSSSAVVGFRPPREDLDGTDKGDGFIS